ncbi:hypothetical protein CK203_087207 [Vitis vinifera]|uniref:Retrotransposon gag domain-containing protein n=1 Tax=Vitis vinifera TaxID=29760 RepID=A0A438BS11_VITVI|nr:hypothetical protein CK203_087207 [Vitis vinifera]
MEKGICTIETWEDFKREIKRQFYPEDVAYLARKNMRRLKHIGSIRDYVKEFSSLMLEIPNMTEEELLFNFMDNLQGWAEQELRRRGVQDLATAMAIAESLADYKRGDSSKIESLEDSHAMGGGDEVPRDHNAPKKGSGKTSNVREGMDKAERKEFTPKIKCFLCDGPHWARDCPKRKALSAMIEEREQEDETHMGSMQLLGALQFNPKPSTPETSLLAGVQVKEEKGERAEVARTHMEEVTKGKVNSMGKRKQHSKHRKRTGLHPSEASREKEVKNILAERVTRRQGVPPVIEYLVRWKGLPKRQSRELKALDAMNSFGLWMTSATLGHDIFASDAMNTSEQCLDLKALPAINRSRCYEALRVTDDKKSSKSSAQDCRFHELLKVVDNMNDFELALDATNNLGLLTIGKTMGHELKALHTMNNSLLSLI